MRQSNDLIFYKLYNKKARIPNILVSVDRKYFKELPFENKKSFNILIANQT